VVNQLSLFEVFEVNQWILSDGAGMTRAGGSIGVDVNQLRPFEVNQSRPFDGAGMTRARINGKWIPASS